MTTPASSDDTARQLRYLAAALKAPRITEAAARTHSRGRKVGKGGQSQSRNSFFHQ